LYQKKTVSIISNTKATFQQVMKTACIPFDLPEQDGKNSTLKELSKPALRTNRKKKEKKIHSRYHPHFQSYQSSTACGMKMAVACHHSTQAEG
jgi:hypothetical protein